jgi:3-deoxy-manno-octulosonate cytidylyltransferase (CMP-KDO synthetase)
VFKRESLLRFADMEQSSLERAENLEQLRALQDGMTIRLVETEYSTIGVDSPEDLKDVEKALATTYSL